MLHSRSLLVVAVTLLAVPLSTAGARQGGGPSGRSGGAMGPAPRPHDGAIDSPASSSVAPVASQAGQVGGVSSTDEGQILIELRPTDARAPRLFDLNRRTIVFTPDGDGAWSRSVRALSWESPLGERVGHAWPVVFGSFRFPFASREWDSVHISPAGFLTFGGPPPDLGSHRRRTIGEHAETDLRTHPTIAALYKPYLGYAPHHGARDPREAIYVAHHPDRVSITWATSEPERWPHGVSTSRPALIQAVLKQDGTISLAYANVSFGDGVVGLFPNNEPLRGEVLGRMMDRTDVGVPEYLDLLDVTIHASKNDSVFVEWTMRGPIPVPAPGSVFSYRLYLDTDEPYWTRWDSSDKDVSWRVDVWPNGERNGNGGTVVASDSPNRIGLLANISDLSRVSTAVFAATNEFDSSGFLRGDEGPTPVRIELPAATATIDLSRSDSSFSTRHAETFHYRGVPDTEALACRVVAHFGDEFDFIVFHSQFPWDVQQHGSAWNGYYGNVGVTAGTGNQGDSRAPCGQVRLKGHIDQPWWMWDRRVFEAASGVHHPDNAGFDRGLYSFSHELAHSWTADALYMTNAGPVELGPTHWRRELHLPAAFPWRAFGGVHRSLMGGSYWREYGDGSFSLERTSPSTLGFSWLDLYAMGLADASEVPDMFIVRNATRVGSGRYRGQKEVVTIEQIIAADGPRRPTRANSPEEFNVGFVYLLAPGEKPSAELLNLHAQFRDAALEHWFHVTGGRSRLTARIPVVSAR